jgi:hypothetical protein
MTYKQKADMVMWGHLLFIALVIISLPLLFLISWWYMVVLILTISAFLSWIAFRGRCYITILENKFRKQYDESSAYTGGFMRHYLNETLKVKLPAIIVVTFINIYIFLVFFIALKQAF